MKKSFFIFLILSAILLCFFYYIVFLQCCAPQPTIENTSIAQTIQKAQSLTKKGKFKDAHQKIQELLKSHPKNSELLFAKAMIVFKAGDKQKAIEALKTILVLHPNHKNTHFTLAKIYFDQRRRGISEHHFKKTIALDKNDYFSFYHLGLLANLKNDFKMAQDFFEKSLKIKADFKPAIEALKSLKQKPTQN